MRIPIGSEEFALNLYLQPNPSIKCNEKGGRIAPDFGVGDRLKVGVFDSQSPLHIIMSAHSRLLLPIKGHDSYIYVDNNIIY